MFVVYVAFSLLAVALACVIVLRHRDDLRSYDEQSTRWRVRPYGNVDLRHSMPRGGRDAEKTASARRGAGLAGGSATARADASRQDRGKEVSPASGC